MKFKMSDAPDLSHLTAEERAIIESVMMRQKQEEEREHEIVKKKQDEVQILEETIRQRSEQHKKAGVELDATCHICLKTKFADGVGHICYYCQIRCCARCGGKVTLRSNKVIWACILCRKRQELLIKTGQWMNNKGVQENGTERKLSISDQNNFDVIGNDKPRFERSKSASDKENNLNRSGSLLRRQYSEHDDSSYNHRYQPQPQSQQFHYQQKNLPACDQQDPSFYKNEISNLFRTHPHLVPHSRQANNHDVANSYSNAATQQLQTRSASQTQLNMSSAPATAAVPAAAVPNQQPHVPVNAPVASNFVEQYPMSIVQQQYLQSHQQPLPPQPHPNDYVPQAAPATMMHRNNSMNSVHSAASYKKHKRNNSLKKNLEKQCSFSSSEDDEFNAIKYQHNNYQIRRQDSFSKKAMLEEKLKKFLTNSVSWKITPDGTKMIGHMILKKSLNDGLSSGSGASILGLKVVGGQMLEDGKLGAIVEKVKKGSVADIEGQLQPGDEILEWNRYFLAEKSYQEVYDIISSTKNEPQIELVVSRYVMAGGAPVCVAAAVGGGGGALKGKRSNNLAKMKPCVTVTCPSSPEYQTALKQNSFTKFQNSVHESTISSVGGKLKMKLGYDYNALQLVVTIECCVGLNFRPNGHLRNPYAKIFLLPDRSEKSKRRTKTLASTNDPYWNQMFVYSGLRKSDLKNRTLEISVWDYVKYGANDFLGEILVDLHSSILKDISEWFQLMDHEDLSTKEYLSFHRNDQESIDADFQLTPSDHLSPPSTVSRLSDSDTPSECDIDSNRHSLERIAADAASMSSIGSSSSPPLPPVHDQQLPVSLPPQHVSAQALADHQLLQQRYHSMTAVTATTKNPQAYLDNRKIIDQNIYETQQRQRHRFTNHRSFSPPPEPYNIESPDRTPYYYMHGSRFQSRSATVTPTGSPKKRQLPQVPPSAGHAVFRDRVVHDLEERAHITRHRMRHLQRYRNVASEGWERNYNGLSDSDIATHSSQQYLRKYKSLRSPEQEIFSSDQNDSDLESLASVTSSALSTQSERPRGSIIYTNNIDSNFKNRKKLVDNSGPKKPVQFSRSLSNDRSNVSNDGSLSDTATSVNNTQTTSEATDSKKSQSTTTKTHTKDQNLSLNKKSHSTNQLSATGRKRRIGFGIKGKSTFTVHRSEEVGPSDLNLLKNSYSLSTDGESVSVDDDRNSTSVKINNENGHQLAEFIDGLGPGQLVGRQVLGSHSLGEIQLSLRIKNRNLEVEVIRARGLQSKPGFKMLPAPYVKLYLVKGKKCIEKLKTISARHTLDPFYQQSLLFGEPFEGCVLQVTVWGDYGRQEGRKVFMGVAQIMLNDLNLSNIVYGWYKLFGTSTLVGCQSSSFEISNQKSIQNFAALKI